MTPDVFPLELGEFYCGYAAAVRERAASGGVVSGLLRYALESGQVEAALVSHITGVDGRLRPVTEEATTLSDVLAAAGSSYVYTRVPTLLAATAAGTMEEIGQRRERRGTSKVTQCA